MRSIAKRTSRTKELAGAFLLVALAVAAVPAQKHDATNKSVAPRYMGMTSPIPGDLVSADAQAAAFNHASQLFRVRHFPTGAPSRANSS
jgi:hypothetical protein